FWIVSRATEADESVISVPGLELGAESIDYLVCDYYVRRCPLFSSRVLPLALVAPETVFRNPPRNWPMQVQYFRGLVTARRYVSSRTPSSSAAYFHSCLHDHFKASIDHALSVKGHRVSVRL